LLKTTPTSAVFFTPQRHTTAPCHALEDVAQVLEVRRMPSGKDCQWTSICTLIWEWMIQDMALCELIGIRGVRRTWFSQQDEFGRDGTM
jgi:hypothetical protein